MEEYNSKRTPWYVRLYLNPNQLSCAAVEYYIRFSSECIDYGMGITAATHHVEIATSLILLCVLCVHVLRLHSKPLTPSRLNTFYHHFQLLISDHLQPSLRSL